MISQLSTALSTRVLQWLTSSHCSFVQGFNQRLKIEEV